MDQAGTGLYELFKVQGYLYLLHLLEYGLEYAKGLLVKALKVKFIIHQHAAPFFIEKLKYLSQSIYFQIVIKFLGFGGNYARSSAVVR